MESRDDGRAKAVLANYLRPLGLEFDAFMPQVRGFFVQAQKHFERLIYRDAVARHLGLKTTDRSDRDSLWVTVGARRGISRKVIAQWLSGEIDPPLEVLEEYLRQNGVRKSSLMAAGLADDAAPVRMGIARTLSYIKVFPPSNVGDLRSSRRVIPEGLMECWLELKWHAHYSTGAKGPRKNLNQHAIDHVQENFDPPIWMRPDKIGKLKRNIETDGERTDAFFWEFLLFKYATLEPLDAQHRHVANQHRWIYDGSHPFFHEVWGPADDDE